MPFPKLLLGKLSR